jgi:hypothetical protein
VLNQTSGCSIPEDLPPLTPEISIQVRPEVCEITGYLVMRRGKSCPGSIPSRTCRYLAP